MQSKYTRKRLKRQRQEKMIRRNEALLRGPGKKKTPPPVQQPTPTAVAINAQLELYRAKVEFYQWEIEQYGLEVLERYRKKLT